MSRWTPSYLYWGAGWLLAGFLAVELAAYTGLIPLHTLSETVWHAFQAHPWLKPLVFATLIFLFAHFFYRRPIVASLAFGLVVAYGAHLLDKAWP